MVHNDLAIEPILLVNSCTCWTKQRMKKSVRWVANRVCVDGERGGSPFGRDRCKSTSVVESSSTALDLPTTWSQQCRLYIPTSLPPAIFCLRHHRTSIPRTTLVSFFVRFPSFFPPLPATSSLSSSPNMAAAVLPPNQHNIALSSTANTSSPVMDSKAGVKQESHTTGMSRLLPSPIVAYSSKRSIPKPHLHFYPIPFHRHH